MTDGTVTPWLEWAMTQRLAKGDPSSVTTEPSRSQADAASFSVQIPTFPCGRSRPDDSAAIRKTAEIRVDIAPQSQRPRQES